MSTPATVPVRRWSVEATAIAAVGASLLIALAERVARIEGALTGPYQLLPSAPEAGK